jgi:hypothetical protein
MKNPSHMCPNILNGRYLSAIYHSSHPLIEHALQLQRGVLRRSFQSIVIGESDAKSDTVAIRPF